MENRKSSMFLVRFGVLGFVIFNFVDGQPVFETDKFRNFAIPAFQRKFLDFATKALQNETIAYLFKQNSPSRPSNGQTGTSPQGSLKQMLRELVSKVDKKHSEAVGALKLLKEEFEKNLRTGRQAPLSRPPQLCCSSGSSPMFARKFSYEARLRDTVNVNEECVGKTAQASLTPFTLRADDAFRLMKTNYQNNTSLLWQYVSTLDGHYVQFPGKNRYCDDDGHITGPLTQRWLVDKLLQRRLNLVVLLDAGETMNTIVPRSAPGPPVQHMTMAKHAIRRLVKELASVDRVSVVVMNGSAVTPAGCSDRLMIASDRNVDLITKFVDDVKVADQPNPNLAESFRKAYSLLRAENSAKRGTKDTNDVIMLITNGEYVVLDEDTVKNNIQTGQNALNRSVRHMVFLIQSRSVTPALDTVTKLADLNHLTLPGADTWEGVSGPVGPEGLLTVVPETAAFGFSDFVTKFYQALPMEFAQGVDPVTTVSPRADPRVGLVLTWAAPVYNSTLKDVNSLCGAVAVDASMTSLFDDVIHFRWRSKSYAFLAERDRGLVLVHPKLDSPALQTAEDPVMSNLQYMEPSLTPDQRDVIMAANSSVQSLTAEIVPGRMTYKTGLDLSSVTAEPAWVLFSRLPGTDFIVGLVVFQDELTPQPPTSPSRGSTLGFKGEAVYHHQLLINSPTSPKVCTSFGDVRAEDKVTVKFSPDVFTEPELYKYSTESPEQIAGMARFLNQDGPPPPSMKQEGVVSVLGDLRTISSPLLMTVWQDTADDEIVERVIGTPNGVFAAYPGISLPNAFDVREYGWYRESVTLPQTVRVSLRRSFTSPDRRVIISTALSGRQGVFGATGVTMSRRSFAGLFFNTVDQCLGSSYSCHLLTDNGYLLDMLEVSTPPGSQRHLTAVYPWLANVLIRRQVMKSSWCTSLSEGRGSLGYALRVPDTGLSHESQVPDVCRHYLLSPVQGSNLLVLVLIGRQKEGCNENQTPLETCVSGGIQGREAKCVHCEAEPRGITPAPLPFPPRPNCQCPCHCAVDVSVCQDSFTAMEKAGNAPLHLCRGKTGTPREGKPPSPVSGDGGLPSLATAEGHPPAIAMGEGTVLGLTSGDETKPNLVTTPCDQPCPSIEKKEDCETVSQCIWEDDKVYPVCKGHVQISSTIATSVTTENSSSQTISIHEKTTIKIYRKTSTTPVPDVSKQEPITSTPNPPQEKTTNSGSVAPPGQTEDPTSAMSPEQSTEEQSTVLGSTSAHNTESERPAADEENSSLAGGAIAGITAGVLAVVAVGFLTGYKFIRRLAKRDAGCAAMDMTTDQTTDRATDRPVTTSRPPSQHINAGLSSKA